MFSLSRLGIYFVHDLAPRARFFGNGKLRTLGVVGRCYFLFIWCLNTAIRARICGSGRSRFAVYQTHWLWLVDYYCASTWVGPRTWWLLMLGGARSIAWQRISDRRQQVCFQG